MPRTSKFVDVIIVSNDPRPEFKVRM